MAESVNPIRQRLTFARLPAYARQMDALGALLDNPASRTAVALRAVLDPPFGIRVQDEVPLAVIAVVRGTVWVLPDRGPQERLGPGDLAVVRGPQHYSVADHPASPLRTVILPGNRSATLDGDELCDEMDLGLRTWGDRADAATVMLVASYPTPGAVSASLLRSLPQVLVLHRDEWDSRLVPLLTEELDRDAPGQDAVLDRVLDLLLITGLRAWLTRPDSPTPDWYRGRSDPAVGRALASIHDEPGHPWTLAALAAQAGVSRATLARRFAELVGQPPMAYLTQWRLSLAADLLKAPGSTVEAVAHQVGYGSGFALSTAFKRSRGVTPSQHRTRS